MFAVTGQTSPYRLQMALRVKKLAPSTVFVVPFKFVTYASQKTCFLDSAQLFSVRNSFCSRFTALKNAPRLMFLPLNLCNTSFLTLHPRASLSATALQRIPVEQQRVRVPCLRQVLPREGPQHPRLHPQRAARASRLHQSPHVPSVLPSGFVRSGGLVSRGYQEGAGPSVFPKRHRAAGPGLDGDLKCDSLVLYCLYSPVPVC